MSKLTSSTAWTRATSRENNPPRIGKYFFKFFTRNSASAISVLGAQYSQQATLWPGLTSLSTGSFSVQTAFTYGQRGAKRQPGAMSPLIVGTTPGIVSS